ncbi:hypothetical protein [Shewanella algae]|uniref:hypothetical protein n=1 Tax=Shewanella algae TaxID=38313 RepID=UPI001BF035BD|nr:hypothetical protein [Shewanella algae]BCV62892.1 hypothetical protein TUM17386_25630 [Shewanella algae]
MPKSSADFPFPTPYEILRAIANAMDVKHSNKLLDERAFERNFDRRELEQVITQIGKSVDKSIGTDFSQLLTEFLREQVSEYLKFIGGTSACGLRREQMLPLLAQDQLTCALAQFALKIKDTFKGPEPVFLFSFDTSTITTVLNWFENAIPEWAGYVKTLEKPDRDRIGSWLKGNELPSSQSIALLDQKAPPESRDALKINWSQIKALLVWARAIDSIHKSVSTSAIFDEVRALLWGARKKSVISTAIRDIQQSAQIQLGSTLALIGLLQHELRRTSTKEKSPEFYWEALSQARKLLSGTTHHKPNQYWLDWHEARWHVFSGDLISANKFYELAFQDCLFRAGINQKRIIEEALTVAACQRTPDKVFLKHLKWAQINFGYDIPSVTSSQPSKKFDDSIEPWEIKNWRSAFERTFPPAGWFESTSYDLSSMQYGVSAVVLDSVKPDYRHPDRVIKVGMPWKKSMPQLVWFFMTHQYEICEELLKRGASVDVYSESNETPLMMALTPLAVFDPSPTNLDDRFFRLIIKYPHKSETVNMRSQKLRILPIISAVQSGKIDIVSTVLAMGADPNGRGETDEQTPLNVCLRIIGFLKNPEKAIVNQLSMGITPEVLDSIRRHMPSANGIALNDQMNSQTNPELQKVYEVFLRVWLDRVLEHMDLASMREIATLLISSGADSNITFKSPVNGYTPLMLATELDEVDLFKLMLIHGGDPKKTFYCTGQQQHLSCFELASAYQSKAVMRLLEDISPNLQGA